MKYPLHRAFRYGAILLPILAATGCEKEKSVVVQDVPKEASAAAPTVESDSAVSSGVAGATWTLPAGWTAKPGDAMRLATIHPAGNGNTEIKVSKFGAISGGLGMNVSRWHGDVGLDPVDDEHADAGQQVMIGNRPWTIHDYTGPAAGGRRVIIASTDSGGETWYFKLLGPTEAVGGVKGDFDRFLAGIKFSPAQN